MLGSGYYNRHESGFTYEIYAGYNKGYNLGSNSNYANNNSIKNYHDETNYEQYALKFNIGKRVNRKRLFEYAFSLKSFYLYSQGMYCEKNTSEIYKAGNIPDKAIEIEPQAVFKIGSEKLEIYLQAVYCQLFKWTNTDLYDLWLNNTSEY